MKASRPHHVRHQQFTVPFQFAVHFTRDLFSRDNDALAGVFGPSPSQPKLLVFVEEELTSVSTNLAQSIVDYAAHHDLNLVCAPIALAGGEPIKQSWPAGVEPVLRAINDHRIDRHSYIVAIGGGAFLDAIGFAAAIAHRGVRLIRVPTTVLAQNDSGVGVKNAINYFEKKNWVGTFVPPFAVLNDLAFLDTLPIRDWRAGTAEAVKVAAVRDAGFFAEIERDAGLICARDAGAMERLVVRCAELHMLHIASGDAFEMGSARPLDFGHWAAHKLEAMSNYRLRHGEAVAIGIALDCLYARLEGRLSHADCRRVLDLLMALGFDLWSPELDLRLPGSDVRVLCAGLEEFREHLGGRLTVTLLEEIGRGVEVHHLDSDLLEQALQELATVAAPSYSQRAPLTAA
jgi:3-dehydroquinate synthase